MRAYFVIGLLLAALVGAAIVSLAWQDCPFGITNDPWPGQCGRYWDSDDNGFCDHGEPSPEDRGIVVPDSETEAETDEDLPDNTASQGSDSDIESDGPVRLRTYHVLEIGAVLSTLYFFTYMASQKGHLTYSNHKRLWNWMLLATFLLSAFLGLILAISLSYGWVFPFSDSLYVHVEFGAAMAIISIFHVLWHWKYWKRGLSTPRPEPKKQSKKKRRN